jgi:signal transduction histidine kinase/CheY-like chemotaxis protein
MKNTSLDFINKEIRNGRNNISCEYKRKFNDEYRWVALDIQVTDSSNGVVKEMVFATKDINEERNEELKRNLELKNALLEAKNANESKTTFLSNMSHDMRTPMNAILGMTDLALMHMEDEKRVKDSLNKIKLSGKHLLQLINEVLDMSHIESGKISLKKDKVNLPELFHDIVYMLQERIKSKKLKFKAVAIGVVNEIVITDVVRLRQILTNILINAIKYTPEYGNVELFIEQYDKDSKDVSEYKITVSDTGVGMDQEFLQKIYEPFERAMDTTSSGIEGVGLGMSITKKIVEVLGGSIKIESEVGKGSKFEIIIPMECVDKPLDCRDMTDLSEYDVIYFEDELEPLTDKISKMSKKEKLVIIHSYDISEYISDIRTLGITKTYLEPVFKSDLIENRDVSEDMCDSEFNKIAYENKKVLVAEDNEINQCIICDYLEDFGITVELAGNGLEAYEKIVSDNSFDLVLMDIKMPVMDGYEATRKIRAYGQPYTDNIPIIAMTANAFAEDVKMAKQVGMNEHVSKPIEFDKFEDVIRNYLG